MKEEILFGPNNFGIELTEEQIKYYLDLVNLPLDYLDKNPFELSGGEMRKVAIISILSYNPEYIIFDEPTVGLDYCTKQSIFSLIKDLHDLGKTIIVSTHWINEFANFKPKVFLLKEGRELFKGEFNDFILLDEKLLFDAGIILDEKLQLYKCAVKRGQKIWQRKFLPYKEGGLRLKKISLVILFLILMLSLGYSRSSTDFDLRRTFLIYTEGDSEISSLLDYNLKTIMQQQGKYKVVTRDDIF